MSWADVGIFYRAAIRRVDRGANGFAGAAAVMEAPDPSWVTDHTFEWVSDLRQNASEAKSDTKHDARIEKLLAQSAAAAKGTAGPKDTPTAAAKTQQQPSAAAGKKRKRGAKKPNTNGGAPPSGGTALVVAAPAPAAAALGLDFDMAAETAKL